MSSSLAENTGILSMLRFFAAF